MRILMIFLIVFSIGCSNQDNDRLETDKSISKVFNGDEIKDVSKIIGFFDSQIAIQNDNKGSNLNENYEVFFDRIAEEIQTGKYDIMIPFCEQKELYNQINESTFNQIWMFQKVYPNPEQNKESLNINFDGKYMHLLQELGTDNSLIMEYYDACLASGMISATNIWIMAKDFKNLDFNKPAIRFVIATHYLTINDGFERKKN